MHVELQNKHEGGPISIAPPPHAICCTSGNVKVPAGTLHVECPRLECTALNGTPALLQTHIYKLLWVIRHRTRGFYIHCNRDARITSSVIKWQGKFMASELVNIWKENGTDQIELHLGICLQELRIITKTHRMTDNLAEIATGNIIELQISNTTGNVRLSQHWGAFA